MTDEAVSAPPSQVQVAPLVDIDAPQAPPPPPEPSDSDLLQFVLASCSKRSRQKLVHEYHAAASHSARVCVARRRGGCSSPSTVPFTLASL